MTDDLISRQAAFKAIEIFGDKRTLDDVYERLEKIPTADVRENVHATWQRDIIEHGAVRVYEGKWECSNCGYGEDVPTVMGKPTIWHFCPNCGAKMEADDGKVH